jgi:outer membrane protein assembly factor BamB
MRIMSYRLPALLASLLAAAAAAQTPGTVATRALEPASEDLSRLNLVTAWRLYLPVASRSDGIATVQPFDDQVYVQLESGVIVAIQAQEDPKTFRKAGDVIWTFRPARPPGMVRPLAVGPKEVYVVQGQRLMIIDRADGKLKYTEDLSSTGQNAPAVDNFALYIPLGNRKIVAYSHEAKIPGYRPSKPVEYPDPVSRLTLAALPTDALSTPQNRSPSIAMLETVRPPFYRNADSIDRSPSIGMLRTLRPPYREVEISRTPSVGLLPNLRDVHELSSKEAPTRIKFLWELLAGGRLNDTPVLTFDPTDPDSERLISSTGRSVFTARREGSRTNTISTEYIAEANVSAPLTHRGDYLYVGTADSNVISLSIRELREPSLAANTLARGKFTTGGPVEQKPLLTEDSLYVVGSRWGLIRLSHNSLDPLWTERLPDGRIRPRPNTDVERIVSVNKSYVYAIDRQGRLLVIDAVRGSTLSSFDVSAFTVPITNEVNDRLYLASNSGLLVCIHDRTRVNPELLNKPAAVKKAAPEPEPEPEPKKGPDAAPKKGPEEKKGAEEKKGPEDKK